MTARITSIKKPKRLEKFEHWQREPATSVTVSVPFETLPKSVDFFVLDEFGEIKHPLHLVKCTYLNFPEVKIDFVDPSCFLAVFWR
jgi:hypothetical protein